MNHDLRILTDRELKDVVRRHVPVSEAAVSTYLTLAFGAMRREKLLVVRCSPEVYARLTAGAELSIAPELFDERVTG